MIIESNLVDLRERCIYPAKISVVDGRIAAIEALDQVPDDAGFIMPGFVDAHVHIESSMMPPTEFARLAVVHGTVGTVSDPHEIANVLGVAGVEFMLREARRTPFRFCFGAPSCVPATSFETAGAVLNAQDVAQLLDCEDIGYLSEVMNFPGVLHGDPDLMQKIAAAKAVNKPVDGHAPGLSGDDAVRYFAQGISTDHECFTLEEGLEKARLGVKILIREGSAARNFEALWPLIKSYPQQVMFCSDDKHPDDLIKGHINLLAARAIALGCDVFDTLWAACIHPVLHYRLPLGLLRVGDSADFIRVKDLATFDVLETRIAGEILAQNGESLLPHLAGETPNYFLAKERLVADFQIITNEKSLDVHVIEAWDGQIVTGHLLEKISTTDGQIRADTSLDTLKICVLNRYTEAARPAMGLVRGFGLKHGALASTVAHDSHNIVVVGADDASICAAVNALIQCKGGIAAVDGQTGEIRVMALPIAGLMSDVDGYTLSQEYAALDEWTKSGLGCTLRAPFMVLSFLALPVIPALKMTDLGLFDVQRFKKIPLFCHLRPIQPNDNEAVAKIIRTVMTEYGAVGKGFSIEDPEVDHMCEAYAHERAAYYVIEANDGRLLGCGGVAPLEGGAAGTCELKKMYFYPELRGLGWGKRLVLALEDEARKRGFDTMYLETLGRMDLANRLYQHMDFIQISGPNGNTGHNSCDHFYEKKL
jgi:adenine deaminase